MSTQQQALPLHLHTLESLCQSLIAGTAIERGGHQEKFRLETPESRSILQWYWENQEIWATVTRIVTRSEDCEAIARQVDLDPPSQMVCRRAFPQQRKRIFRLLSLRAHRFGGLHRFGSVDRAPDLFECEFRRPLTVVEGKNGAGKSSLLSAVCWCLTGLAYRPQRAPEVMNGVAMPVALVNESLGEESSHHISPLTPVPPADVLEALSQSTVPVDTWVEVLLEDNEGQQITIRRSLRRTTRGSIQEDASDISALGLDPIAWSLGTVLSAQVPYITLDRPSDLGSAVASLTGLRPLKDLAKHARRVKEKLAKDLHKERTKELFALEQDFQRERKILLELLREVPLIAQEHDVPVSSSEENAVDVLRGMTERVGVLLASALSDAKKVLGEEFDPTDPSVRSELKSSLPIALFATETNSLRRLQSLERLSALRLIRPEELNRASELVKIVESQALELSNLEQNPDRAARNRLYQRVAGWLRSRPEKLQSILACPLCLRPFTGEPDPVLGDSVSALLQSHLEHDKPFLEKTLEAWVTEAAQRVTAELAAPLQEDLPAHPWNLVSRALSEEMLDRKEFQGCLIPFKYVVRDLCVQAFDQLPSFDDPDKRILPPIFGEAGRNLNLKLWRIRRAINFCRWLQRNKEKFNEAYRQVVGSTDPVNLSEGGMATLRSRLAILENLVISGKPLEELERQAQRLSDLLVKRQGIDRQLERYQRATVAIEPLTHLDKLVEEQLGKLIEGLSADTEKWKHCLFRAATVEAPTFYRGDVAADGRVELSSQIGGTIVPSQHIANASDLRATLLAFLFAFLEHVLQERGGLALLLLDDPQELFDPFNRRSVASTIPKLIPKMNILVTTNDGAFRDGVFQSMKSAGQAAKLQCFRLHPCQKYREHAQLTMFTREIDELKANLKKPENYENDEAARCYAKEVREYVEARLIDCLGDVEVGVEQSDLNGLLKKIGGLSRDGHELFSCASFRNLVKEFPPSTSNPTLELLNRAHHGKPPRVQFVEVWEALTRLERLQSLAEQVQIDLDFWLRRDLLDAEKSAVLPPPPGPATFHHREFRVVTGLAAFSATDPVKIPTELGEPFDIDWFKNKALYRLTTNSFGFAACAGQVAIVDLCEGEVEDGRLVIALYREKIFARRLLRFGGNGDVVALGSEAENPLERKPSLILPVSQVRLLKVVGILFHTELIAAVGREEAVLLETVERLHGAEVLFRVEGESALPLALDNQWVLGGPPVSVPDFHSLTGSIVAIATHDQAYLKRIGRSVGSESGYRFFESIGFGGDSLLLRIGENELESSFGDVETIISARRVLGVLYESNGGQG